MNLAAEAQVLKTNLRFKAELKRQWEFFKKPQTLIALGASAVALLTGFLIEDKSKAQEKYDTQNDPTSKAILDFTTNQMDESILNDSLLQCMNDGTLPDLPDEVSADTLLAYTNEVNDIDDKASKSLINKVLGVNPELGALAITGSVMLYHIALTAKDLFTKTDHPSRYRTKYIQRLIRNTYTVLKGNLDAFVKNEVAAVKATPGKVKNASVDEYKDVKDNIKATLKSLKLIDAAIIAMGIATALYLSNLAKIQKKSTDALIEASLDATCESVPPAFDVSVNIIPLPDNLSCLAIPDVDLVPHEPIESKLQNMDCVIDSTIPPEDDSTQYTDHVTIAIVRNSSGQMGTTLIKGSKVSESDFILNVGPKMIYSPISGTVLDISTNQIVFNDLIESPTSYLASHITMLNEKYQRAMDVKSFIRTYYPHTLYPVLLSTSITDGKKTTDLTTGIKSDFDKAKRRIGRDIEAYEKNVKDITGKDNVEKNAKNETLYIIKDQVEAEEATMFKAIKAEGESAKKRSLRITALPPELNLLPYYQDLVKTIDASTATPTQVELDFSKLINGFIETRKTPHDPTKETVKEGTSINAFIEQSYNEISTIPTDIDNIQKEIDKVSSLQTFSLTDYNGEQAKLYTIAEDASCKSQETDPYINPASKYGYKDIEYWLKWCAGATLASVATPATGWSTGWLTPPTPFPVVYIPAKSIQTTYGFIVLGLTICGVFVFPFAMFMNGTLNHSLPIGNPLAALTNEINAAKKAYAQGLDSLRNATLKPLIDKTKTEIDTSNETIKSLKDDLVLLRMTKPKKEPNKPHTPVLQLPQTISTKALDTTDWANAWASTNELLLKEKLNRFALTKKHRTLLKVSRGEKTSIQDPGLEALDQTKKKLDKQLDNVSNLQDSLDSTVASLPISLKPNESSFALTPKNPKPNIKIASKLNDNVGDSQVDAIATPASLTSEDKMLPPKSLDARLASSQITYPKYKKLLSSKKLLTVTKDPFPSYELLRPTNVQWLAYLIKDHAPTGAQSFGFPGFPPIGV